MGKNLGSIDRILRVVVGLALISLLYFAAVPFSGLYGLLLPLVGLVLVVTGSVSFCPLYRVLGLSS